MLVGVGVWAGDWIVSIPNFLAMYSLSRGHAFKMTTSWSQQTFLIRVSV
ncbi:hypothetical protein CaCOL14_008491 [Colletotrichum acutatum]